MKPIRSRLWIAIATVSLTLLFAAGTGLFIHYLPNSEKFGPVAAYLTFLSSLVVAAFTLAYVIQTGRLVHSSEDLLKAAQNQADAAQENINLLRKQWDSERAVCCSFWIHKGDHAGFEYDVIDSAGQPRKLRFPRMELVIWSRGTEAFKIISGVVRTGEPDDFSVALPICELLLNGGKSEKISITFPVFCGLCRVNRHEDLRIPPGTASFSVVLNYDAWTGGNIPTQPETFDINFPPNFTDYQIKRRVHA